MNKVRAIFSAYLLIGLAVFSFAAQTANAQGNARSEREVRRLLQNLSAKVDDFRYRLSYGGNGNNAENLSRDVRALQDNLRSFETKFNNKRENTQDVETLLDAARNADESVNQSGLGAREATDWANIRGAFEQLAASYNIRFDWEARVADNSSDNADDAPLRPIDNRFPNGNLPQPPRSSSSSGGNNNSYALLTGTYRLDAAKSEAVDDVVRGAIGAGDSADENDLRRKLTAPEELAIDARGNNQITIASSRAPQQITFTADGREQTQRDADGKTVRLRAGLRGQELSVSKIGGRDEDYTVVFAPDDNGRALRVTRRVTTDYLNETVFLESYYTKTDSVARLGINSDSTDSSYSSSDSSDNGSNRDGNYPTTTNGRTGNFVVGNGVILTGTLRNDISTKFSQNNDRFQLSVTAPNEFRGAVIEGRLSGLSRSGKVSGRSQITFNFETIRLSNGETYDFAGFLQSVTNAEGKQVKVDTEGTARGDSQTKETVKRGSIGAGIGAVIGAIAGGAQGAAIGAIIGGGAGAGSVVVEGKDDLELKAGSSVTVQSSSPSR